MSANLDDDGAASAASEIDLQLTTRVFTTVETLTETLNSNEQTVTRTQLFPLTDTLTFTVVQTQTLTSGGLTAVQTQTSTQVQLETRTSTTTETLTLPGINGVETFLREATQTQTVVETISLPIPTSAPSISSSASASTSASSPSPSSADDGGHMHPELIGVIVALSLIVSILLVMLGICILKRRRARRRWGPPRSQILFDPEADLPPERGMKGRMEDSGLETQDVIPAPFVVEVYPQPEPTAGPSTGGPSPMARRDVRMPVDKKLATEFSATRVVTNRQSEDFNPPPRYTVVYGQRSSDVAGLASPPLPPLPSPSFSLQ